MKKIPKKLYKYMSFSEYSISNIINNTIYFSDPKNFNDPFELRQPFDVDNNMTHEEKRYMCKQYEEFHNKGFDWNLYNGSIEKLYFALEDGIEKIIEELTTRVGISCFSENNNSILMWAHYSNYHTGFCLEFDTNYPTFSKAIKVEYVPELERQILDKSVPDNGYEAFCNLFRYKFIDWKYEKEWRAFNYEKGIHEFDSRALTAVYFGCKMPKRQQEIILSILKSRYQDNSSISKPKVYQMIESQDSFKIEPGEPITY